MAFAKTAEKSVFSKTLKSTAALFLLLFLVFSYSISAQDRISLQQAADNGDLETVKSLLSKRIDINAKDSKGNTALRCAAYSGHTEIVKLLLEKKADVSIKDSKGRTPLHAATYKNHIKIVDLLIRHGSVVWEKDSKGRTAVCIADKQKHSELSRSLRFAWGYQYNLQLSEKAEKGDTQAMATLAKRYFFGEGSKREHKKALFWIRKAAEITGKRGGWQADYVRSILQLVDGAKYTIYYKDGRKSKELKEVPDNFSNIKEVTKTYFYISGYTHWRTSSGATRPNVKWHSMDQKAYWTGNFWIAKSEVDNHKTKAYNHAVAEVLRAKSEEKDKNKIKFLSKTEEMLKIISRSMFDKAAKLVKVKK
ncbi:MAG: ankyrin repeat domain-containing protein [Planctomycetota bacterium]|jgi:hypothetical protein